MRLFIRLTLDFDETLSNIIAIIQRVYHYYALIWWSYIFHSEAFFVLLFLLVFRSQYLPSLHETPTKNLSTVPPSGDFIHFAQFKARSNVPYFVSWRGLTRTLIPVLSSTFRSSGLAPDFLSQYCHGYSTQDTVPSSVIKQFYLTAQTLGIQGGAYRSNLGTGVGISHYSLLTKHSHSERQKETMTSFRRFLSSPQFREAPAEIQIQNCAHSYWQKLENERHGIPLRYMVKCQNVRTVSLLVP